jgi:hypothetical protein
VRNNVVAAVEVVAVVDDGHWPRREGQESDEYKGEKKVRRKETAGSVRSSVLVVIGSRCDRESARPKAERHGVSRVLWQCTSDMT